MLWTIRNGTVEVDGEGDEKRAAFLVFVGRFVPMQVFVHLSCKRWLVIPEV